MKLTENREYYVTVTLYTGEIERWEYLTKEQAMSVLGRYRENTDCIYADAGFMK